MNLSVEELLIQKKMCCQLTQCDLAERELQKNYNWGNINVGRVKWQKNVDKSMIFKMNN